MDETTEFEGDELHDDTAEADTERDWIEEENEEGQLMIDVYQTSDEVVVQSMVAGVDHNDLHVSINREMVTISGRRQHPRGIKEDDYFYKELYWGPFSRTILLPQEIDPEAAEAVEKNGLLTLNLPKIDKNKQKEVKIKSI